MPSFEEALAGTARPAPEEDGRPWVDDEVVESEVTPVEERPASAAARMLELASVTADQLVTDAKTEAESLGTTAQARAEEIVEASRHEANKVAAELAHTRAEHAADLERERATALAGLAEERAALEERIATLSKMESDWRNQMRHRLTEQLALLDSTLPGPSAAAAE